MVGKGLLFWGGSFLMSREGKRRDSRSQAHAFLVPHHHQEGGIGRGPRISTPWLLLVPRDLSMRVTDFQGVRYANQEAHHPATRFPSAQDSHLSPPESRIGTRCPTLPVTAPLLLRSYISATFRLSLFLLPPCCVGAEGWGEKG